MSDNMRLWKYAESTDPSFTKKVTLRGGYTAIDPHHQLHMATALWGPYGKTWGISNTEWTVGQLGSQDPYIALDATFFYTDPVDSVNPNDQVCFPISVDMPFKPNDDCRKKLMTEARSKALSYLGFNADVFFGKYDDNRYVDQMKARYTDEENLVIRIKTSLRSAESVSQLQARRSKLDQYFSEESISKVAWEECHAIFNKELERLNGQRADAAGNEQAG